jgi:signal transduction histidine kinase
MVLYVSRSVARPLARLSEGASAVASGDLDSRIDVDTNDEFGVVATEFNAMTIALKQHQERSVESEKLAGIGRVAAGVAHELNNPLQVMLGYLALNRDVADPVLACQLAAIEEEALRCKTIIDGMLELSRPPTQASMTVDLRELCDDVCASLRVAAQPHIPQMVVRGAAEASGDRARLRQAVFNLMKNAVEAAGPEGQVSVSLALNGDRAEIAVSDTGPGLAADARARMFEPFFTTKQEGTGLGLAVSRAVARAHGGEIEVRTADGAGAIFTLRLPRVREARS